MNNFNRLIEELDPMYKSGDSDIDQHELEMGIKAETDQHHIDDPDIAREVAINHLREDPLYYTHMNTREANDEDLVSDLKHHTLDK